MKPILSARQYLCLDLVILLAMLGAAAWHALNSQWVWLTFDTAVVFMYASHIRHWLKVLGRSRTGEIASR